MTYFTLTELQRSDTAARYGIDNRAPATATSDLLQLVRHVLDPLREAWGQPIIVTSGYRCPELNRLVGGAKNSQHMQGRAADIRALSARTADNRRLFELAQTLRLPFDQLIDEYGLRWLHISYNPLRTTQRRQVLHLGR